VNCLNGSPTFNHCHLMLMTIRNVQNCNCIRLRSGWSTGRSRWHITYQKIMVRFLLQNNNGLVKAHHHQWNNCIYRNSLTDLSGEWNLIQREHTVKSAQPRKPCTVCMFAAFEKKRIHPNTAGYTAAMSLMTFANWKHLIGRRIERMHVPNRNRSKH